MHILAINYEFLDAFEVREALMVKSNELLFLLLFDVLWVLLLVKFLLAVVFVILCKLACGLFGFQLNAGSLDRDVIQEGVSLEARRRLIIRTILRLNFESLLPIKSIGVHSVIVVDCLWNGLVFTLVRQACLLKPALILSALAVISLRLLERFAAFTACFVGSFGIRAARWLHESSLLGP